MLWLIVFFYGGEVENLNELLACIYINLKDLSIPSLIAALPVGVIIHQFSVVIKNCIGSLISEFSDFPKVENIINLDSKRIKVDYILERISNLNSFYYVRFDNGILSPLLAWIVISLLMGVNINSIWTLSALLIGFVTSMYIPRIWCELKYYNDALKKI